MRFHLLSLIRAFFRGISGFLFKVGEVTDDRGSPEVLSARVSPEPILPEENSAEKERLEPLPVGNLTLEPDLLETVTGEPMISISEEEPPVDLSRWTVTLHAESPFEKVGRYYLSGENLVLRSDYDRRGFSLKLADVDDVLNGAIGQVYLLDGETVVGTAKVSVSGKGVNFSIAPFFYTTPLSSLVRVLSREVRKGPLFVGREQVEPNYVQ